MPLHADDELPFPRIFDALDDAVRSTCGRFQIITHTANRLMMMRINANGPVTG